MIILVGPSASGKTAVGKLLEEKYNINKVVTYTTRDKRVNEVDNIDYHFISIDKFIELKNNNFFFETTLYNNNYYGTSIESLNNNSYMILDIEGYNNYKKSNLNIMCFYFDCSKETRQMRMSKRLDNEKDIEKRLEIDDSNFSKSRLDSNVVIINTENKSIEEIGEYIYGLYTAKFR